MGDSQPSYDKGLQSPTQSSSSDTHSTLHPPWALIMSKQQDLESQFENFQTAFQHIDSPLKVKGLSRQRSATWRA